MWRANQLDVDRAFVLVIDIQQKLLPAIRHNERLVATCRKLLDAARIFDLPVLATQQYPKGIGPTDPAIARCLDAAGATTVDKLTFSAWGETAVREAILAIDRPQVILLGIEAHVCVQQTALDLVSRDYDVFVCADAVGSRGRLDYERSLDRMRQEGASVTTVESVLFELCNRCDTPQFKAMLEVIKDTPPAND
ncbi:MAG: hydrolase [Phycisphaerae bacterium]|jgi:isochorismate hydrolase